MKHNNIYFYIIVIFLVCNGLSYSDTTSIILNKQVETFSVSTMSLLDSVYKLMIEQKICICIEEIPYNEKSERILKTYLGMTTSDIRRKEIAAHLDHGTVKDVLNALTTADTDYTWENSDNDVINIIPRIKANQGLNDSILNWQVPTYSYTSAAIGEIILMHKRDDLGVKSFGELLNEHGIYTSVYFDNTLATALRRPQTIHLTQPISARELLNKLVNGAGSGVFWHLSGTKGSQGLTFGYVQ